MRAKGFVLRGATAVVLVLAAAPAFAVDLQDAVRAALKTNPDVGIVVENRRATEKELDQAWSGYFPSLDVTGSYGYQATNDPSTRNRLKSPGEDGTVNMAFYTSSLTLSQMLFDGFETQYEIERQEARVRAAARRVRETSEFIGLDAIEAYFESLRQRELVAIAEDNIRVHEQTLDLVQQKVQGGAAGQGDVQQADSRLASARDTLAEAEGRLRDADATYSRIVGEDPRDLVRPVPPLESLPATLDEAVDFALSFNPTVRVARADVEIAKTEVHQTESAFWPDVSLDLSANHNRHAEGTRGNDTDVTGQVTVSYNIFSGGADTNRRQEFIYRLAETRQRYNRAVRLTEEEMRLAWNALISARDRLTALRSQVQANDQVRSTYRQQFDIGQRSLLDLLDSENEFFLSRSNMVTSEFVELFGVFRILAQAGLLLTTLDVQPSRAAFSDEENVDRVERTVDQRVRPAGPADPNAPVLDPGSPSVLDPSSPSVLDPSSPAVLDPNSPTMLDPSQLAPAPLDPMQPAPMNPMQPAPSSSPSAPPGAVLDPTQPPSPSPSAPPGAVLDPTQPPQQSRAGSYMRQQQPAGVQAGAPAGQARMPAAAAAPRKTAGMSPFFGFQPAPPAGNGLVAPASAPASAPATPAQAPSYAPTQATSQSWPTPTSLPHGVQAAQPSDRTYASQPGDATPRTAAPGQTVQEASGSPRLLAPWGFR